MYWEHTGTRYSTSAELSVKPLSLQEITYGSLFLTFADRATQYNLSN